MSALMSIQSFIKSKIYQPNYSWLPNRTICQPIIAYFRIYSTVSEIRLSTQVNLLKHWLLQYYRRHGHREAIYQPRSSDIPLSWYFFCSASLVCLFRQNNIYNGWISRFQPFTHCPLWTRSRYGPLNSIAHNGE